MNSEQKFIYVQQMYIKMDVYTLKMECILNNFKNIDIKNLISHHYENFSQDEIFYWNEEQLIELENRYDNILNDIKKIANEKNIDLFENEDLNYFITHYNITFKDDEDEKSFIIEI
jgi:hypothetical protein